MELKNNNDSITPIFIIGAPRSGTTLLRLMLSSHSNITIPHEFTLVENVIQYFENDLNTKNKIIEFLEKQYSYSHFIDWNIPKQKLITNFKDNIYTKAQIIDIVYKTYIEIHSPKKQIWGDKNINSLSYIEEIYKLFPNVKFIHIIRDGRDVAASLQSRKWMFYSIKDKRDFYIKHPKGAMLTWKNSVEIIEKSLSIIPTSSSIKVKYEDLIKDSELQLQNICHFLNVDFELDMLRFFEIEKLKKTISNKRLLGTHENTLKPVLTSNTNKYLNFYSPNEVLYLEKIGKKQLINNDYNLDSSRSLLASFIIKMDITYIFKYTIIFLLYKSKQLVKKIIS